MELPSKTYDKVKRRISDSTIRRKNLQWFKDFYFDRTMEAKRYPEFNKGEFKFIVGKIYTFFYFDPKYKKTLDFYNAIPVGIFLGYHKGSGNPLFLALQFIPPKTRIEILDKIANYNLADIDKSIETIRNSRSSVRKLDTTYYDLKKYLMKSGFEFAIRSYILGRIQNKPQIITYWDWWRIATFSGQFMKKMHIIAIYNEYKKFAQSQSQ